MSRIMVALWISLGVVLAGSLIAWAAPDDVKFTYQGTIERNGIPLEGNHQLRFTLYDNATALAPVFDFPSVMLARGQFSVLLGPLTAQMLASTQLQVAVQVDGVDLQGRQRIQAVPFAMRGRGDGLFTVDNRLSVAGPIDATGAISTTGNISGASINATGTYNGLKIGDLGHPGWNGVQNGVLSTPNRFALLQSNDGVTTIVNAASSTGNVNFNIANTPSASVRANGEMRLLNEYVPAGPENLRIIRGTVNGDGTVRHGSGFTVSRNGGQYTVSFNTAFSSVPSMTCTGTHPNTGNQTSGTVFCTLLHPGEQTASAMKVIVSDGGSTAQAWGFSFIAVGPR